MIHYTCDLCGRSIQDERYVAKIEVSAAFDPDELTEDDLVEDHLQQIADTIEEMETTGEFELEETGPKLFQYDLCHSCCRRYLKSPLQPAPALRLNYSDN